MKFGQESFESIAKLVHVRHISLFMKKDRILTRTAVTTSPWYDDGAGCGQSA